MNAEAVAAAAAQAPMGIPGQGNYERVFQREPWL